MIVNEMKKHKIYFAPLQGITSHDYRSLYQKYFGAIDLFFSPFILTKNNPNLKSGKFRDILPQNNRQLKLIPQIMGNNGADMISLAKILYEVNYAIVNWNLGCPFPTVVKKRKGSGLLPHKDQIQAILDQVLPRIPNQLSLKLRLGYTNNEEILELIPILNQYPVHELIIHARTGVQMYSGEVQLKVFEECLKMSQHKIVYNGDIFDLTFFKKISCQYQNLDTWMLGRGILRNPYLPREIKELNLPPDQIEQIKKFHQELLEQYQIKLSGPKPVLNKMKEIMIYLSHSFSQREFYLNKILKSRTIEQYQMQVQQMMLNP